VEKSQVAEIREAASPQAIEQVRALFHEYWSAFGFTPCFQGFNAEVATLPGRYGPPRGRLLLAIVNGEPAGCAALRPFDEARCEMKRMYVRPAFRGMGVGKALMEALISEARTIGYREILCDTIPQTMSEALAMYERFGFTRTGPYAEDPTPAAVYLRLVIPRA
jgi:putative acetyltransferase